MKPSSAGDSYKISGVVLKLHSSSCIHRQEDSHDQSVGLSWEMSTNLHHSLVLKWMRHLVSRKHHIGVAVQLPAECSTTIKKLINHIPTRLQKETIDWYTTIAAPLISIANKSCLTRVLLQMILRWIGSRGLVHKSRRRVALETKRMHDWPSTKPQLTMFMNFCKD